jgi:hypothetical protein
VTHARVSLYLRQLGLLCLEVADNPKLLPTFLRLIVLVPATVAELRRDSRRLAA